MKSTSCNGGRHADIRWDIAFTRKVATPTNDRTNICQYNCVIAATSNASTWRKSERHIRLTKRITAPTYDNAIALQRNGMLLAFGDGDTTS
jgi:hypothetical protein